MKIRVNNEDSVGTSMTMDVFAWDSRKATGPDEIEVTVSPDDLLWLGARARSFAQERRDDDPDFAEELQQRGVKFAESDDVFVRDPHATVEYFESRHWRTEAINDLLDRADGLEPPSRSRFVVVGFLGGRLEGDQVVLRFTGRHERQVD